MAFANIGELAAAVGADAVAALAEAGWDLPVQVCASGTEGCVALLRFDAGDQPPQVLTAHHEGGESPLAAVLVFTSPSHRVAMVIIEGGKAGDIVLLR